VKGRFGDWEKGRLNPFKSPLWKAFPKKRGASGGFNNICKN